MMIMMTDNDSHDDKCTMYSMHVLYSDQYGLDSCSFSIN